jgi:hypothetical protein
MPPLSRIQQKALIIYAKVLELAAVGGTDYSSAISTTLVSDALSTTCGMNDGDLEAALVNINFLNAEAAGATVPASLNAKMNAVRCLIAVDEALLNKLDLFLTCQLGEHAAQ